ncbi:MAG: aminotransferase class I/II-fold pyridoxal phosphate-dependent enzyme [Planctomycetota bacterium]|nr:MAG: aminotransferase class I/II-fold pyridoxal phosphate-dependent enzyme [Planctomycetota bacterium]
MPPAVGNNGGADRSRSPTAIARVVLEELARVQPPGKRRVIADRSTLAEVGIDEADFLDAVNRIEGRYQMRFREEWLSEIVTCGDLMDCIARHMFDELDVDGPLMAEDAVVGQAVTPGSKRVRPAGSTSSVPAMAHPQSAAAGVAVSTRKRRAPTGRVATAQSGFPPEGDPFPEIGVLEERLRGLEAAGLENPFLRANQRVRGRTARIAGHDVVSFTSFDYLGLAGHPDVTRAAKEAIDRFGCSASASRMVGGNNTQLDELDAELASFVGTERATVFPCGYGTNASVFGHLFGADDLILYDELAHNSIVQGAVASKAGKRSFRHNDHRQLDGLLRDLRSRYRRVVVALEGVYSMDGDYPDLPEFIEVKRRHDALLYVDEAHSVGTMGPEGRGICDHFGVDPAEGDLWMGTISKALGAGGGYLAGSERLIRYLGYTTPAFVFSTACSPPNVAAALEGLKVIGREPWRVTRLRERSEFFLKLAADCDLDTGPSGDTPVIPVIVGSSNRAILVSQLLLERGINAQPILYPAVRESAARVRFFITAEHSEEQIARTVGVLAEVVPESARMIR